MSHEHPSGLSYTINTNLDPTISLDGLRLMTPAEDNIQADIAQASLPRSTQPQDTIQRLNFIVSSFQNEECSKVQALMELLNIINQQSNLSELQKGQTFDKYHSQINSIESTLKGTGNPVVFSNTPSSPEVTSRTVVSVPSQSRVCCYISVECIAPANFYHRQRLKHKSVPQVSSSTRLLRRIGKKAIIIGTMAGCSWTTSSENISSRTGFAFRVAMLT